MILSKNTVNTISTKRGEYAREGNALPIKVIQFGTGILLRGLPDYMIDQANKQGLFNGRIVAVKSTGSGDISDFREQDCLYTLLIRGIRENKPVEESVICESIAEVLPASTEWARVLSESHNPELKLVISNTTEAGIRFLEEDIKQAPPVSFPGKLLAFLYERYQFFEGALDAGLIIIPTELLPNNAEILKEILLKLSHHNSLDINFINWIISSNRFCNSLVDRIVPGNLPVPEHLAFEEASGYQDALLITAEPYQLWAIEGNDVVREALSFAQIADSGVVITEDITAFRELKLRLLNGSHTMLCGLAVLASFDTVKNACDNFAFQHHALELMDEIAECIPYQIDHAQIHAFAKDVMERFKNPFIQHRWLSISLQYSMKLKMRVLPLLHEYHKKFNKIPERIAMGFAAYIVFMRSDKRGEEYYGSFGAVSYLITDDQAGRLHEFWIDVSLNNIADTVLGESAIWGENLSEIPNFSPLVQQYVERFFQATSQASLLKQIS